MSYFSFQFSDILFHFLANISIGIEKLLWCSYCFYVKVVVLLYSLLLLSMMNRLFSYFKFNCFPLQSRAHSVIIWTFIISTSNYYCHLDVVYVIIIREEKGVELPISWAVLIVIKEWSALKGNEMSVLFTLCIRLWLTRENSSLQWISGTRWICKSLDFVFFRHPQDLSRQYFPKLV